MSILCKSIELSAEMVEMEIKKNVYFNELEVVGRDERICNSGLFVLKIMERTIEQEK